MGSVVFWWVQVGSRWVQVGSGGFGWVRVFWGGFGCFLVGSGGFRWVQVGSGGLGWVHVLLLTLFTSDISNNFFNYFFHHEIDHSPM